MTEKILNNRFKIKVYYYFGSGEALTSVKTVNQEEFERLLKILEELKEEGIIVDYKIKRL